jgi:hypothetical protein
MSATALVKLLLIAATFASALIYLILGSRMAVILLGGPPSAFAWRPTDPLLEPHASSSARSGHAASLLR